MARSITRRTAAAVIGAMLACMCAIALTAPHKAYADELTAASLTTQKAASNTTRYYAKPLQSGKGVIGTFKSKDDTNTNLYEYWYKFKTSKHWSVYSVKIESIDGRNVRCSAFKADGSMDYAWRLGIAGGGSWEGRYATNTDKAATGYNTAAKPNTWYYFEVASAHNNSALRNDQFKITVTEHPIIKGVTGVKSAKATKTAVTLKWNKQANATKYQVKWKKKGGSWKTATVKANSKKFTKLAKNSKYQFKVRAYCKNGYDIANSKTASWSSWSNVKTVKTKK